jgi:metallo-beta-lactamase class B
MPRFRAALALGFLAGCLPTAAGPATGIQLADDVCVEKLNEDVWRHVTTSNYPGLGPVPANGLIVANDAGAVVVDTGWNTDQTRRILDWIEGELRRNVLGVVVTHAHEDRLGGMAEALRRHIRVISSRQTAALARAKGAPAPTETFLETLTVSLGKETVKIVHPGPGHTADNVVVWLPRPRVLFGGCLVKAARDKTLGYVKDADLEAWPKTMEKVAKEFPEAEIVVPGHGDVGGRELLSHTLELLPPKP